MNTEINLLNENRETLTSLYFKGLEEKEAITKRLLIAKNPDEQILKEYQIVSNLITAIARVVYND